MLGLVLFTCLLFYAEGIQKARSDITAPHIIDATEDGVGDTNLLAATKSKVTVAKLIKPAKKEEVSKTADDQAPYEVDAKFYSKKGGEDGEESEDEEDEEEGDGGDADGAEEAEKKSNLKKKDTVKGQKVSTKRTDKKLTHAHHDKHMTENSKKKTKISKEEKRVSKKASKKSRHEDPKPTPAMKKRDEDPQPTIGMKSRINVSFKKSETKKTNKVVVTRSKIKIEESKKDKTTSSKKKETPKQEKDTDDFMTEKGDTAAFTKVKGGKKSSTVTKRKTVVRLETAKKRTKDDDDKDDAIIADLSGAGSGETDTDMLSGDTRSLEDASGDADIVDADEEEEDSDDSDSDSARARQNLQLHGDPEMVDLKPKEPKIQPDLNDFPDKDDSKTSFHADSKPEKAAEKEPGKEDADKKTSSPDEAELDDIKIEELLNPKPEQKKKKKTTAKKAKESSSSQMEKGKISLVLQQNFNVLYEKQDSPSYQMLAGNIKKDIEKMVPGTDVNDVAFSEVSVEGNPRQSGKTKANFNLKAPTNEWMKDLLKLVDGGDIDGLRVIKGSLEIEESE